MTILTVVQSLAVLWLAIYGLNSLILAAVYLCHRQDKERAPAVPPLALPLVSVQIPVYNEVHVVERVIDAVAALDYPRDRLQIQVLDDSIDDTTRLAMARSAYHRAQGIDIAVLRRPSRQGFKAGALAWGLSQARGEFVALFDADFLPSPDFLLQVVPHFLSRPRLGMVQTRWTYLNCDYSPLTRAQTLALDGHFVVEQLARSRSELLMSFNGTGGMWRRACIEECGGWQADTLCEDLDLSYRAQLGGWESLYLPAVEAPGELPPQIEAFKRQQSRWAQGSVQALRKLAGPILRHRRLRWWQKAMACVHLSSYLAHPLMVLVLLTSVPLLLLPDAMPSAFGGLGLICMGPLIVHVYSQRQLHRRWGRKLRPLPLVVLVGIGIAWSNSIAVWRGLTRWGGAFNRTPKFRLEGRSGGWTKSAYRLRTDSTAIGEIALALYAVAATVTAVLSKQYGTALFIMLYAAGFGLVAGMGLLQTARD